MTKENKWILTSRQLPPCDGHYEISLDGIHSDFSDFAYYDGYGFKPDPDRYVDAVYWRYCAGKVKKYGRQDD